MLVVKNAAALRRWAGAAEEQGLAVEALRTRTPPRTPAQIRADLERAIALAKTPLERRVKERALERLQQGR